MSGKIVGAKLVFGVESVCDQIVCPRRQHIPVFGRIVCIAFRIGNCCGEDEHIAAFLDRHVSTVSLTVRDRVGAYIVSGKRFFPFSAFTVIKDVVEQAFAQFGIVEQEQRRGRIGYIHCADRAVAEIFFRQKEQIAVRRFHQFVCGNRLSINQCT